MLKCPKGETVWVQYIDSSSNPAFILTSKESSRDYYFLYEVTQAGLVKLGKARSPTELEEKYKVVEKLQKP